MTVAYLPPRNCSRPARWNPRLAWLRARGGMETGRQIGRDAGRRPAATGLEQQGQDDFFDLMCYLDEKHTALLPRTKELVTLGLIRLVAEDPAAAAEQVSKWRWRDRAHAGRTQLCLGRHRQTCGAEAVGMKRLLIFWRMRTANTCSPTIWSGRCALRCARQVEQVLDATGSDGRDPAAGAGLDDWRARALTSAGRPAADRAQADGTLRKHCQRARFL